MNNKIESSQLKRYRYSIFKGSTGPCSPEMKVFTILHGPWQGTADSSAKDGDPYMTVPPCLIMATLHPQEVTMCFFSVCLDEASVQCRGETNKN